VAFLVFGEENHREINERILQNKERLKSPFEKGGFRGISRAYFKSPLTPL
jgi:hypothetical protein